MKPKLSNLLRSRGRIYSNRAAAAFVRITAALALVLTTFAPVAAANAVAPNAKNNLQTGGPTTFMVRIENVSGHSDLPGPFAPGVWTVNDPSVTPFFDADTPDRGDGLAALAEDGAAAGLAAAVAGQTGIHSSGVFNTPVGAGGPGPLFPGQTYEFEVTANPGDYLSFASMLVQTNDIFVGPDANGVALFETDGTPRSGDITSETPFWDVGSEMNEAPGMGPNQAPRQRGPNTGPAEGVVSAFGNSTRSLPLAGGIVDVTVSENNGEFTITVQNISGNAGAIDTPIAPVFYATHNGDWSLFTAGANASAGLEELAEAGSPAGLVGEHSGATGTGMVGAQPITDQRPGDGPGPAFTGESYSFSVTPTAAYPNLTFAAMVVQTNDVFLAPSAAGIALLDSSGNPRSVEQIMADIDRMLAIWDAGTEANEVPGVGPNQAPRQATADSGSPDPIPGVRLYSDSTNDLDTDPTNDRDGEGAGGFASIVVTNGANPGDFNVTLTNSSDQTVYPGILTPVAYAVHSDDVKIFMPGMPASEGLERLSEDGNFQPLVDMLSAASGVSMAGAQPVADGATDPGPLMPGHSYSFSVSADSDHPYLSVASMIVPSNDTFFAFEPTGVQLINSDGTPRADAEIAADIAAMRLAWDAGTERNQAGAAGPDQAPRQAGPNTGADEGPATVRLLNDPVWNYPTASDVVRVTIEPMMAEEGDIIYLSTSEWGEVDGISFTDEDIMAFDTATGEWSKFFDASDVGLRWNDLDAFTFMEDGSILMSFNSPRRFDGRWIDDSDIIRFIPETLGSNTSGTFEYYFDGSDVDLRSRFEDIDALHMMADGRLAISTLGPFRVQGVQGRDEDLALFKPHRLGRSTRGRWMRYFDGSDVKLRAIREDVKGTWIDETSGDIYLSMHGNFSVEGLSGDGNDIVRFTPSHLGAQTQGTFAPFFDGGAHGLDGLHIDAFAIGGPVNVNVSSAEEAVSAAAIDVDYDAPEENTAEADLVDDLYMSDADHNADDTSDGLGDVDVFILLPLINK